MKKTIYIVSTFVFLGILATLFIFIKLYNKPHIDVNFSTSDYKVSIEEVTLEFNQDEENANQKYLDKIIQFDGIINHIDILDGNSTLTLSSDTNPTQTVVCNMAASQNIKIVQLELGQKITVKGICTGYLMDIMLVKTVIVN